MNELCNGLQGHTILTSNVGRMTQFMTQELGLRVLKRTVHHHNECLSKVYFGVARFSPDAGQPVISCIEWSPIFYSVPERGLVSADASRAATSKPVIGDPKGRWGTGTNHHLAFHVASRDALLKWKRRLSDRGIFVTGPYFRNYFHAVYFRDPDGAIVEIATSGPGFQHDEAVLGSGHRRPPKDAVVGFRLELDIAAETWPDPVPEITPEMCLLGFHHITSVSADAGCNEVFYVERLGLNLIKRTDYLDANGTHYYYSAGPGIAPGSILTFFGLPEYSRGRLGVGLAHHFTLLARDDDALATWRETLLSHGVAASEIEDHIYYQGFYLEDPDGHIVSVATRPRFDLDEDAGSLGARLCLPEWMETRRDEIERVLALHPAPGAP